MDDDDDMSDAEFAESEPGHSASGDSAFDSEWSTSEDQVLETELHAGRIQYQVPICLSPRNQPRM